MGWFRDPEFTEEDIAAFHLDELQAKIKGAKVEIEDEGEFITFSADTLVEPLIELIEEDEDGSTNASDDISER